MSIPLVRGVAALAESLLLGSQALKWSQSVAEERVESGAVLVGARLAVSIAAIGAVFAVLPALLADLVPTTWFFRNMIEGVIRIVLLLGYVAGIAALPGIRRVYEYHGAEHKAIAAWEHDAPLQPASVQRFSVRHPRCGTSFLLSVVVVAVAVYSLLGRPAWPLLIASRLGLLPVVAAFAYEVIRFGSRRDGAFGHAMQWPGLALQHLTTREPDDQQVEVALAALTLAAQAETTD